MKNFNLTGLYIELVKNYGVVGFNLSSIIPNSKEPLDAIINFESNVDVKDLDLQAITEVVNRNITGEVKLVNVTLNPIKRQIRVYVEFMQSDLQDTYAYQLG